MLEVEAKSLSYEVRNLTTNQQYTFRVGAWTMMGAGQLTREVRAAPLGKGGFKFMHIT